MNLSVHAGVGASSTPHGLEKSTGEDGLTVHLERNKSDVAYDAIKLEQGGQKEEGKEEESITQAINLKADDENDNEEEGEYEDEDEDKNDVVEGRNALVPNGVFLGTNKIESHGKVHVCRVLISLKTPKQYLNLCVSSHS